MALALVGCTVENGSAPADEAPPVAYSVSACSAQTTQEAVPGVWRPWDCGTTVQLYYGGADNTVVAALDATIATWNGALQAEAGSGVPRLSRITSYPQDSAARRRTVTVTANGTSGTWCDVTDISARTMQLFRRPIGVSPCTGNQGTLNATVLHGAGHVLGLKSSLHNKGRDFPGISSHCSIVLPDAGGINPGLCQHEVDLLLMAYEVYPNSYDLGFWGQHILSNVVFPASVTLREDETRTLTPTGPFFRLAGSPPAVNTVQVSWTTSAERIAVVDEQNVLRPRRPGAATVAAVVLQNGLPGTVRRSARLRSEGQRVTVSVTQAFWRPGYRVSDILGPPSPITEPGTYTFTAQVVNGGTADSLRVTWRIVRTFDLSDTVVVSQIPNPLSLAVARGSYRLRLIATPLDLVSDSTGGSLIKEFPVCTGLGLQGAGAGTDAITGCDGDGGPIE